MVKDHFSDTGLEYAQWKYEMFGVADRIQLVQGRFEDSLDHTLAHEMFSLAFLDCDLYQSAKYSLTWLTSRLANGGVIVMHDYFAGSGIPQAVHEWCRNNGLKVSLCPVPHIFIRVSGGLKR
jgi:predicted O-methyltransferase YrrM